MLINNSNVLWSRNQQEFAKFEANGCSCNIKVSIFNSSLIPFNGSINLTSNM